MLRLMSCRSGATIRTIWHWRVRSPATLVSLLAFEGLPPAAVLFGRRRGDIRLAVQFGGPWRSRLAMAGWTVGGLTAWGQFGDSQVSSI